MNTEVDRVRGKLVAATCCGRLFRFHETGRTVSIAALIGCVGTPFSLVLYRADVGACADYGLPVELLRRED